MIEELLLDHIGPEVKIKEIRKTLDIENKRLVLTVIPEVEMQDVTIEINLVD